MREVPPLEVVVHGRDGELERIRAPWDADKARELLRSVREKHEGDKRVTSVYLFRGKDPVDPVFLKLYVEKYGPESTGKPGDVFVSNEDWDTMQREKKTPKRARAPERMTTRQVVALAKSRKKAADQIEKFIHHAIRALENSEKEFGTADDRAQALRELRSARERVVKLGQGST